MAKSKENLVEDYLELGGKREDFPEDLADITAADIMAAIEDQKNKKEAEATKSKLDEEVKAASDDQDKDQETPQAPAPTPKDGVTFTLTKANTYSTGRLPGKVYVAGETFTTNNQEEIKVLRASGRFKEGE